jgi:diphthamide biosynthesis protein 4
MRKGVSAGDDRSITIDQINLAYRVLSDSSARMEYDRLLRLQTQQPQNDMVKEAPGLETIDLDDMFFDEAQATWYRGCRCGRERAFVVSEQELEQEAQYGEIVLGCDGCSLWLRVTFQVDEEK